MLLSPEQLVEQIHDAPARIVLAAAGGGSRAIADLLEVPGGSRTLLEAVVPYSAPAMIDWLGGKPDESCSAATSRAMAVVAFQRARRYELPDAVSAGVACTASLASDRPKHGPHRIHVALQTAAATASWHLELHKDRRSRAEEERLAGHLLLNVVAEACNVPARLPLELLEGEHVDVSRFEAPAAWQDLLLGRVESVRIGPEAEPPVAIIPGAFNPLHAGHRRIAEIAAEMLHGPVAWEISIENVEKPPLDYMELDRRLRQFAADQVICLTRAITFEEKSRLFPKATFLVGADTLRRIAAREYYANDAACERSIAAIARNGCRFLVFGRILNENFVSLADIDLPESLRTLCREVPADIFRDDISSTALRSSGAP